MQGGMLVFVENKATANVDGVDVVIGVLSRNKDRSWSWSCRWCTVTGRTADRLSAHNALIAHAEPSHEDEVDEEWALARAKPQVLGACPQPLREWLSRLLHRYPSHILFVTLFGARVTGTGESSSPWDIQIDLRPSAPDELQAQIRQDTALAAAAPPEGLRLWIDSTQDDEYGHRLARGWQRIADVPETGTSVSPVSVNASDDSYQWHCDLCGAHGVVPIRADGMHFPSPQHVRAAHDATRRAKADCDAHIRRAHRWSWLR
jgi:hypothetical protein